MPDGLALAALTELADAEDPADALRAMRRARAALGPDADLLVPLMDRLVRRASEIDQLRRLAGSDALTGAANRRAFDEALRREIARVGRGTRGPAVILFDLDGLKQINDAHGHAAGDEAIVAAVEALRVGVRATDLVARIGGDELAVLLPETDEASAVAVAQRLRALVEARAVRGCVVRTSLGYAVADGRMDAATLVAYADTRLYADKRARRRGALADVA